MKILRSVQSGFLALVALLGASLYAQTDPQVTMLAPSPQTQNAPVKLSPEDLSQLLAPIALYPDALIALILPASTVPSDVVLGARYLQNNGNPDQVAGQPWDDSVKSLTRYPDVLAWMDKNLDWTDSVGEAFVNQPADVMNAIQALRAKAKAAGNLVDTPQQKVVQEQPEVIRIVPADPEVIYVPEYNPEVVYEQPYSPGLPPLLSFGLGFAVGSWLNYDFDWGNRCLYRGNWNNNGWNYNNWNHNNGGWNNGGGGNVNVVNITNNNATPWQPTAASQQQLVRRARNNGGNARFVNTTADRAAVNGNVQGVDRHRNQLPKPTNFTETRQNRPNPKDAAAIQHGYRGPGAANPAPATVNEARPVSGPEAANATPATVNEVRPVNPVPTAPTDVTQAGPKNNHRNGAGHGAVTPSAAPNVSGQLGNPAAAPGQSDRHHNNRGDGTVNSPTSAPVPSSAPAVTNDRHHTPKTAVPQDAPAVPGQINSTGNSRSQNADKPERHHDQPSVPSAAPQPAPHAPAPDSGGGNYHHPQSSQPVSQAPNQAPKHSEAAPTKPESRHQSSSAPASHPQQQSHSQQSSQPQQSHHQQQEQSQPKAQSQNSAQPSHAAPSNKGSQQKSDKKKDKDNS